MTPYLKAALEQHGQDGVDWLLILQVDKARLLPTHIEQRLRIEGLIKFKYREPEARLTRRGRRAARMLADHTTRPLTPSDGGGKDG